MKRLKLFLVSLVLISAVANLSALNYIWIEGEDYLESSHDVNGQFAPKNDDEASKLSGAKWLNGNYEKMEEGEAYGVWDFTVDQGGSYQFFIRKFWHHGPFRWQIDGGEWHVIDYSPGFLDRVELRRFVEATWVEAGGTKLEEGKHTLRIEMLKREHGISRGFGIDVIMFVDAFVIPAGKAKPGTKLTNANPGMFAFSPDADNFTDEAELDLSYLNEDVAGQDGYMYSDGENLYLGSGEKVRLWGVNLENHSLGYEAMEYAAKRYAKRGVNIVRCFWPLFNRNSPVEKYEIDDHLLHTYHNAIAAFKKHGIYIKTTPYFSSGTVIRKDWGWEFFDIDVQPAPLYLFVIDELQTIYKERVKKLMTAVNPKTGLSLAKDPALAIYQIHNEDSFFWMFHPNMLRTPYLEDMVKKFGEFLIEKYGSTEAVYKAWGMTPEDTRSYFRFSKHEEEYKKSIAKGVWWATNPYLAYSDTPESNYFALASTYELSFKNQSFNKHRAADQIEFTRKIMLDFYDDIRELLRDELGYEGLISSCNWRGGFDANLHDLERSTYINDDVIDNHHYFAPPHINPTHKQRASWDVQVGDSYAHLSALGVPAAFPGPNYKHMAGKPAIVSEANWAAPNKYQTEGPFLVSTYGAMSGLDGFIWFGTYIPEFQADVKKFQAGIPSIVGQFPAAALLFRKGYVTEADVVVNDKRSLKDMYYKTIPGVKETIKYDPNRDSEYKFGEAADDGGQHPLSYLVGKVKMTITNFSYTWADDLYLDMFINEGAGYVESHTGELKLDWQKKYSRVNAPKAQGVLGHIKGMEIECDDISIESENDFISILVVPLDDKPLEDSKKILVQAMTYYQPYGWEQEPTTFKMSSRGPTFSGYKILNKGGKPANVELIEATIHFEDSIDGAYALGENGYRAPDKSPVEVKRKMVVLPRDTLYTIVYRD